MYSVTRDVKSTRMRILHAAQNSLGGRSPPGPLRMPKKTNRSLPGENLARNLAYLMDKHEMSLRHVSDKTGGQVSPKTIGNMRNQVGASNIDNVEAVARVFGLQGWHLIAPNLIDDLSGETAIRSLYESYMASNKEGRLHIIRIAEREAEFNRTRDAV